MDFISTPQSPETHRPHAGAPRPMPQRRVFNDFVTRPAALRPVPAQPAKTAPTLKPAAPQPKPTYMSPPPAKLTVPTPSIPAVPAPHILAKPTPAPPANETRSDEPKATKESKPRSQTGHAGLVGFAVFVMLGGLLLSPLLPSKIIYGLPGSSQSSSSGDQTLECLHDLGRITSIISYDSKFGSPINYNYSSTTTEQASCDGKLETAQAGHDSQFSPLGLAIDVAAATVVAVAVAKIWRKIFGTKNS